MPLAAQTERPSAVLGGDLSPPMEIAGLVAKPAVPLEFSRAWLSRMAHVRQRRAELAAAGRLDGMTPESLAAEGAALAGTLRVPVIPVHYADVAPPFPEEALTKRLFGPADGDTMSYAAYWREVSGGLLEVEGMVAPWTRLEHPAENYLPRDEYGWSRFGRTADLRKEALAAADRRIDFAKFDNDGPDGIPNSGDDDGFVDFVAILYATRCDRNWREGAIWPHRGAMVPFETSAKAANGGRIKVADYVILSAVEPATCTPLHIGVLAHETGHALGLPDLYDYDGSSQGTGAWSLMGMGSHSARYSPAHLDAWSKEQLGWVRVAWLSNDRPHLEAEPVARSRTVYRHDLRTGQYLLLENRQRIGSDAQLPGSGLLVWRVDPDRAELGAWNGDERHPAVGLVEADGRDDLLRGGSADEGDPFPGSSHRDTVVFDGLLPLRLSGIVERDGVISADLAIGFSEPTLVASPFVRLTALSGDTLVSRTIAIQREGGALSDWSAITEAPWIRVTRFGDVLRVRADATDLEPGTYTETVRLSLDGSDQVAGRVQVALTVAEPGVPEVIATDLPWGWGLAARAGRIFQASYGWDPLGLRPRPRLLHLPDGATHARTLARLPAEALYAPVSGARDGVYVLARARDENYLYRVRSDGRAEVVATGLGTTPAYGAAAMPDGTVVVADWQGGIRRVSPDGVVAPAIGFGTRIYQIATDSAGTIFAAAYSGEILKLDSGGRVGTIPTGFEKGRLVTIAATPAGEIFAAERGGEGRILRIAADGSRSEIGRIAGAEFYGLAVDERFLYALDLRHRQIVRFAVDGGSKPVSASK